MDLVEKPNLGKKLIHLYKSQLIKLPAENYEKSLKNFLGLKDHNNFYKYKVFDYRIQDQLILK